MRVFHRDIRQGEVRLGVESLDDLWYLSSIIQPGDLVKAKTERRVKGKEDVERAGRSERVTVTITIRVEKADFKLEDDSLRITGVIESGPDDIVSVGTHHTFSVEKDSMLTITKDKWSGFEIDRLKEAERSTLRPKLLVAVIDEGEATIALVRESKIEFFDLAKAIGGKYETKGRQERKAEFFRETADFVSGVMKKENISAVIVAGAGFEKENFFNFLAEKHPEISKKAVVENIGSHGRAGISEVMKRSKAKKVEDEVNSARDIRVINKLLEEIGKDTGLGAYGLEDIKAAAGNGAIESLIVCDDFFFRNRDRLESLMNEVKKARGLVHIINHGSEAGSQLSSLGGVAGILRFRVK